MENDYKRQQILHVILNVLCLIGNIVIFIGCCWVAVTTGWWICMLIPLIYTFKVTKDADDKMNDNNND